VKLTERDRDFLRDLAAGKPVAASRFNRLIDLKLVEYEAKIVLNGGTATFTRRGGITEAGRAALEEG
jgi:hypothetical protein